MPTYNLVKPIWSNGAHPVSDAPSAMLAHMERVLVREDRGNEDLVRWHYDSAKGIAVAWLRIRVALPHRPGAGVHRSALYLHAIGVDGDEAPRLTRKAARALFERIYGANLPGGLDAQQSFFGQLCYPEDADAAGELFVGGRQRALELRRPVTRRLAMQSDIEQDVPGSTPVEPDEAAPATAASDVLDHAGAIAGAIEGTATEPAAGGARRCSLSGLLSGPSPVPFRLDREEMERHRQLWPHLRDHPA